VAAEAIVHVPARARRGEVIEIRTLVRHPMESGYRRDARGNAVPRNILRQLVCTYNGEEILRVELHPAVAANPAMSFTTVATESGTIELRWTGDAGFALVHTASITVE